MTPGPGEPGMSIRVIVTEEQTVDGRGSEFLEVLEDAEAPAPEIFGVAGVMLMEGGK